MVINVAKALIGSRNIKINTVGIRPGEKLHEILVSDEEAHRTVERGEWYAILPMLPEVCGERTGSGCLIKEYSSGDNVMTLEETVQILSERRLMMEDANPNSEELLR